MKYYAGIDGGQSSTSAAIGDETGRILGRGTGPAADEIGEPPASTRLRDALQTALNDALHASGLPQETRFERIVAGVSGYEGRVYGQPPTLPTVSLTLVHDAVNAHAGAFDGNAGIIVIAGTGSVAYARGEHGADALTGGWGFLFGDEGSAFWIARSALSDAMRDADAGQANDLAPLALQHFKQPSLRALSRAFYAGEIARAQLARFAVDVLQAAERGSDPAGRYVRDGAKALVSLAMRTGVRCALPANADAAFVGGVSRSPTMQGEIAQWMRALLPNARHVAAKHDAAAGGLILAYRASGIEQALSA